LIGFTDHPSTLPALQNVVYSSEAATKFKNRKIDGGPRFLDGLGLVVIVGVVQVIQSKWKYTSCQKENVREG
jgi:hypothetical protein